MLAASASPAHDVGDRAGPTLEVRGPCVDRTALLTEIEGSRGTTLTVTASTAGLDRIRIELRMRASGRRDQRRFSLVEADCPFAAALVARVWKRFLSELPVIPPARDPNLPLWPRWPKRQSWDFAIGLSPGLAGTAERWEARLTRTEGPAAVGRWRWGVSYDLLRIDPLGEGSAWVHAWALFGGLAWSGAGRGIPIDVGVLGVLGGGVSAGEGFPQDISSFIPVVRARAELRSDLFNHFGPWGVEVGLFAEISAVSLRLVGSQATDVYEEPVARGGLFVGLAWDQIEFFNSP